MNVLAELHREPDMKLNLKFEIEVLCKNLGLDINVSSSHVLFYSKSFELYYSIMSIYPAWGPNPQGEGAIVGVVCPIEMH